MMTLAEFVTRTRDDLNRFRVEVERTQLKQPQALPDKLPLEEWLRLFYFYTDGQSPTPHKKKL
jgi:hypothetical protein